MAAEPRLKPVCGEPSSNGRAAHAPPDSADGVIAEALQRPIASASECTGATAAYAKQAIERYEGPLVRYAARITGDLERGRDVVQETFLRLCREPAVATSDRLGQWLFTVCRRLAIDVRRKEKRMSTHLEGAAMCEAPSRAIGQSETEESESMANLLRQLARLPANQQEVVRLKFQEGMCYKQISSITGLSVSNVGYLLHVAVNTLRERLKRHES